MGKLSNRKIIQGSNAKTERKAKSRDTVNLHTFKFRDITKEQTYNRTLDIRIIIRLYIRIIDTERTNISWHGKWRKEDNLRKVFSKHLL